MCIDSYSDNPSHAALGDTPLALQNVQSAAPDINAPDGNEPVEIDSNLSFETDSAIGSDTSNISDTASLTSSILSHRYENGRTYHSFHDGQYIMPNDDKEQERLDLVHHIWMLILRGELFRAPITKNVQRVLDVGTGTGIWAMDFADQFPGAVVIANDLSAIQPKWVPPNLIFEIDDAESVWPYNRDEPFDYIHIRNMGGSISDWNKLFAQSLEYMSSGGWIEVQEHAVDILSEDGEVPPFTKEMMEKVKEAAKVFGKEMNIAESMHDTLIKAGFEEVQEDKYKIPVLGWARDKRMKEIGRFQGVAVLDSLEAYTLALFTRVLGWDVNTVHIFLAKVRAEIKDPRHHLFIFVYCVYGRKPM